MLGEGGPALAQTLDQLAENTGRKAEGIPFARATHQNVHNYSSSLELPAVLNP